MDNEIEIVTNAEQALLTANINALKRFRVGRQPIYTDDQAGLDKFKEDTINYLNEVRAVNNALDPAEKPLIISIEAWVTSLGFTRGTLFEYRKRGEEWRTTIDYIRELIASNKLQRLMTGKTQPIAGIFDLVNNFGYHNTNDFKKTDTDYIENRQTVQYPTLIEINAK